MVFYPAILFPPDGNGLVGCVIPGPNINAVGAGEEAALNDAVEILEAVLAEAAADGEAVAGPLPVAEVLKEMEDLGGSLVWLPALSPRAA